MSEPESLGEIIRRGRVITPKKKRHRLEMLCLNWKYIAGERTGRHSSPTRLSRGTLTVAAEGPAWAAELSVQTHELIRRAEQILGEDSVKKVRVQARAKASGGVLKGERGKASEPQGERPRLEQKVAEGLGDIEEEGARVALERMIRASIASEQGKQSGR